MKLKKFLVCVCGMTTVLSYSVVAYPESISMPTVKYIIGQVSIVRDGKKVHLKTNDSVRTGDVFNIHKFSLAAFWLRHSNSIIKVKGPCVFVLKSNDLQASVNRGNTLSRLYAKIDKNSVPYYPRTLVTAVRGHEGKETNDKEVQEKLERAIKLAAENSLAEAMKLFTQIEKEYVLNRHAETIVLYYKAQILFAEMDYAKAVSLYNKIYRSRFSVFKYKEEAMVQAILCLDLLGKQMSAVKLAEDYKQKYGNNGAYWNVIKKLGLAKD